MTNPLATRARIPSPQPRPTQTNPRTCTCTCTRTGPQPPPHPRPPAHPSGPPRRWHRALVKGSHHASAAHCTPCGACTHCSGDAFRRHVCGTPSVCRLLSRPVSVRFLARRFPHRPGLTTDLSPVGLGVSLSPRAWFPRLPLCPSCHPPRGRRRPKRPPRSVAHEQAKDSPLVLTISTMLNRPVVGLQSSNMSWPNLLRLGQSLRPQPQSAPSRPCLSDNHGTSRLSIPRNTLWPRGPPLPVFASSLWI